MYRIYYDKKAALVADEEKKVFYYTTIDRAKTVPKKKVLTIKPRTALHQQISLLIEVGYKKSDDGFENQ